MQLDGYPVNAQPNMELTEEQLRRINELLKNFQGNGEIRLVIEEGRLLEINVRKTDQFEA